MPTISSNELHKDESDARPFWKCLPQRHWTLKMTNLLSHDSRQLRSLAMLHIRVFCWKYWGLIVFGLNPWPNPNLSAPKPKVQPVDEFPRRMVFYDFVKGRWQFYKLRLIILDNSTLVLEITATQSEPVCVFRNCHSRQFFISSQPSTLSVLRLIL